MRFLNALVGVGFLVFVTHIYITAPAMMHALWFFNAGIVVLALIGLYGMYTAIWWKNTWTRRKK